ncbi:MAG: VRR-NUC domain-containing protein [Candidatus Nanohaloarchaea archaeon]
MIPFEEEPSLTASEKYAQELLEAKWEHVARATPGIMNDLEERYPKICDIISEKIREDTESQFSNLFRPGVPDFIVFNKKGEYRFIEAKSGDDGLRKTQLKWLRDFEGIQAEIWFTSKHKVEQKLDAENIQAYTFQDKKGNSSENKVVDEKEYKYLIELPKNLASILELKKGDSLNWRLKSKTEIILDSK